MKFRLKIETVCSISCDDPDGMQSLAVYPDDPVYCDIGWRMGGIINKDAVERYLHEEGWRQHGSLTLCPKCAERRGVK